MRDCRCSPPSSTRYSRAPRRAALRHCCAVAGARACGALPDQPQNRGGAQRRTCVIELRAPVRVLHAHGLDAFPMPLAACCSASVSAAARLLLQAPSHARGRATCHVANARGTRALRPGKPGGQPLTRRGLRIRAEWVRRAGTAARSASFGKVIARGTSPYEALQRADSTQLMRLRGLAS